MRRAGIEQGRASDAPRVLRRPRQQRLNRILLLPSRIAVMLSQMDTPSRAAAGPEPESRLKVLGFRPGPNALPNLRHARGP